jgi:hypothetical protein
MRPTFNFVVCALFATVTTTTQAGSIDTDLCASLGDLAYSSAKARDSGVTMQQMLKGTRESGRKGGVSEKEIDLVIETKLLAYRNPNQTPAQIRAFALNSCTEK